MKHLFLISMLVCFTSTAFANSRALNSFAKDDVVIKAQNELLDSGYRPTTTEPDLIQLSAFNAMMGNHGSKWMIIQTFRKNSAAYYMKSIVAEVFLPSGIGFEKVLKVESH